MSILCDNSLIEFIKSGGIKPSEMSNVNPASIDLRIGSDWYDISDKIPKLLHTYAVTLYPRTTLNVLLRRTTLLLATTLEIVKMPANMYGMIKLKTTPCREGLGHPIADWIDPGFEGQLTLMLHAFKEIKLLAGQRICQLVIGNLDERCLMPYVHNGHYMNQRGPTLSWRHKYDR